jgi:hypothetical protein
MWAVRTRSVFAAVFVIFAGMSRYWLLAEWRKAPENPDSGPSPSIRLSLEKFGLAANYMRHDDDDCTAHVIGYRFIVWLDSNVVVVGFNTSPDCRVGEKPVAGGILRLLAFDQQGKLIRQRDLPYDADGGDELVAPGEAMLGPGDTLLVRLEESKSSKSGLLQVDKNLNDVLRIDRFIETRSVMDRSIVFQEGFVLHGPRIYDVYDGSPLAQASRITADWPAGTMDQRVGAKGITYSLCEQELSPEKYSSTNVIYSGAHRRCTLTVQNEDSSSWHAKLLQDQVVQILGTFTDGTVAGIVRHSKMPDRMMLWNPKGQSEELPWFQLGYDTTLLGEAREMNRYIGLGGRMEKEKAKSRLMIFERKLQAPLVDRAFPNGARASLSPDGRKYATFDSGQLQIYSLSNPAEPAQP